MGNKLKTLRQAAVEILQELGPLHYQELTDKLLERGLATSSSKTPAASLNAMIAVDIKRFAYKLLRDGEAIERTGLRTNTRYSLRRSSVSGGRLVPATEATSFVFQRLVAPSYYRDAGRPRRRCSNGQS